MQAATAAEPLNVGRTRPGRLFRKYLVVSVVLVSTALLTSGLVEAYFAYEENQAAVIRLQHERAVAAASSIEQFLGETERLLDWVALGQFPDPPTLEQRRNDYHRLLQLAPSILEVSYVDAGGTEQLTVSRVETAGALSQVDQAQQVWLSEARSRHITFGPVGFRDGSNPFVPIAMAESGPSAGLIVAVWDLESVRDVVSQASVGVSANAYLVDAGGWLIAGIGTTPISQGTDFSSSAQVRAVRGGPFEGRRQFGSADVVETLAPSVIVVSQFDQSDKRVYGSSRDRLLAYEVISAPDWILFVEQPLDLAFAPIRDSLVRTALLLLLGLVPAVLASVFLVRRMLTPIHILQASAGGISQGSLDQRIEIRTGDELEDLAQSFNRMSSYLQESYATLEQKVEERTRDLAEALSQLRALGDVAQAVNSSLDLQQVLTTIVTHAVNLSGSGGGAIYEFDEGTQQFELRATSGISDELTADVLAAHIRLGETVVGEAAIRREPVQSPNTVASPVSLPGTVVEQARFSTLLAVPLLRENRVLGALVVGRGVPGQFPTETVDLLQTFAAQSVLTIQNARLFQEIERKSEQVEVASRHKSEFLANMSHELRTPLNAIIGFSEVLTERLFGDLNDKQAEYLGDIRSSGHHLLSLINDILDLSKVEAGRMELESGIFSLAETLENGVTMVRERAIRHGLQLCLEVDPAIGLIEADERKIKQVIFNLLSNAVKFTPDGGRVEVVARLVDAQVQVAVRDTGIGIAAEDQVRIFEEFQQAPNGQSGAREGTGLGLALARRFVELHGGRLWVESRPGHGSTFTFELPQPTAAETTPFVEEPPRLAEAAMHDERGVLVVEDNPQAIDLLRTYLEADGFSVSVAENGEEGLARARELRPTAIVLDILLPRLDGWDVLARAKADPAIAHIPVVVVSMVDERGKGFALGAADYLVKPVQRDALVATLRRVAQPAGSRNGHARVLAIDDDPLALELIQAALGQEGYDVLKATSGQEGVLVAKREQPGLVILDLLMPGMNGFAVLELLRQDPTTAAIPIVVLTSASMNAEERERLTGQISHLARKGTFNRSDFVRLVRNLCPTSFAGAQSVEDASGR
jgi:signal transduction histidine kinase/CheY-like chemotaxis protein